MSMCVCVCACGCTYVCMYVCMYVRMYVCVFACVRILGGEGEGDSVDACVMVRVYVIARG